MNILLMTSPAPVVAPVSTAEKRVPLGIGYLISSLKREGHRVYFSDEYLRRTGILASAFLKEKHIELVGVYANSICFEGTLELLHSLQRSICFEGTLELLHSLQRLRERKEWAGTIAVGGPHTAVAIETIPAFVNHVVIGEGEISLPRILDGSVSDRIVKGERVADLDDLPMPAWEEFIHRPYQWSDPWVSETPVYSFNTSRGCPYECSFCSVNGVWGRNYRMMSAERVLDDIQHMIRYYGLRTAYFREDHFTLNRSRTVAFCEGVLRRSLDIGWMCESRADSIDDPEVMRLLARSGCRCLYVGVESGSARMLELFRKRETIEQFIRVFDLARQVGIKTYASFVVGAPTETEKDLALTDRLIDRIKPDFVGKNIFVGIPGSDLYRYAKEHELAEFETVGGVLYLKGHDARVDRFNGGDPAMKIPRESGTTSGSRRWFGAWSGRLRGARRIQS